MHTKQTPEVIATRTECDRLLALIPNKRFSDCAPAEQARFTELEAALQAHRAAVRAARKAA